MRLSAFIKETVCLLACFTGLIRTTV